MIKLLIFLAPLMFFVGCESNSPHEKHAQAVASQEGLSAAKKDHFDAVFVSSSVDLASFHNLVTHPLDFSEVKIINPTINSGHQTPWELKDDDKKYYQSRFDASVKEYLYEKAGFREGEATLGTLALTMKVVEIAPLGSKDDLQGRPTMMNVYTRGFGRMTVLIELHDLATNKLVYMATDEHELGVFWERNDRVQNNIQIRLAFEHWMHALSDDLKARKKH